MEGLTHNQCSDQACSHKFKSFFFSNLLFKFALSPSRNRSNEEQNKDRIKKKILKLITKNEVKEFGRIK